MPKKKGGKKGKKGKKAKKDSKTAGIDQTVEACREWGVIPGDIILSPFGVEVSVLGVKWEEVDVESMDFGIRHVGKLIVEYDSWQRAPLYPKNAEEMKKHGYRKAPEWKHIRKKVDIVQDAAKEEAEKEAAIAAHMTIAGS